MTALVDLRDVGKAYVRGTREVVALRDVTLQIEEGESVAITGPSGSGKSTLLHALITNAALRYSPDELEVYLIDFKKGVEFKTYATHDLPHARVIAVDPAAIAWVSLGSLRHTIPR